MSEDINQSLAKAFELIEADEHDRALEIVKPIVESQPDNADAWWIYVHAVSDEEQAQQGLNRLRELDPSYPGLNEIERGADLDDDLDDLDFDRDFDDFDDDFPDPQTQNQQDEQSKGGRARLLRFLIPVFVVIVVIALILVLLNGGNGDDDDDSTVVNAPTVAPTANIIVPDSTEDITPTEDDEATEEPTEDDEATEEPTEDVAPTEVDASNTATVDAQGVAVFDPDVVFRDFDLAEDPLQGRQSSDLGETVVVSICDDPSSDSTRDVADRALLTLAEQELEFESDLDAVAIRIVDCDTDVAINVIGVELADLVAVTSGELSESDFRQSWQAVEVE